MGDIGKISNLRTEPCALTFRGEIDEGKLALPKLRRKNKKIGDISGHVLKGNEVRERWREPESLNNSMEQGSQLVLPVRLLNERKIDFIILVH